MARYGLTEVALAVRGIPITGYADGDSIEIEFSEEMNKKRVGADGEVLFSRTNNNSGTIKINLSYQTRANAVMQDIIANDQQVPISVRDTSGAYFCWAPECVIAQRPSQNHGVEPSEPTYEFHVAELFQTLSGIPFQNILPIT